MIDMRFGAFVGACVTCLGASISVHFGKSWQWGCGWAVFTLLSGLLAPLVAEWRRR